MMTADQAARIIKCGLLEAPKTHIALPWQIVWLIRAGRILP
jgi:hypothetical protein